LRRSVRIAAVVAALFLMVAGASGFALLNLYSRPGPLAAGATVIVPKGATVADIAVSLREAGVITSTLAFRAAVRLAPAPLQAGEYRFPAQASLQTTLAMLQAGETVKRRLTVPEGMTSRQVVALLTEAEGLTGEVAAPPVEGALLPETYNYAWGDSRAEMIRRMSQAMTTTVEDLWAARDPALPLSSPQDAVILASIVEKETGIASERPRVAAVFLNRLRLGMKLQADPTVAYAVYGGSGVGPPLTLTDLQYASPYNTYAVAGLPPGPIANPGRAALAAVLQPAATDELYFVADGSGGHVFARTLNEHQRNVARWRKANERIGIN